MQRSAIHKKIALGALLMAIIAMPYSILLCHVGLIIFILNWLLSGNWPDKKKLLMANPTAWLFPALFLFHLIGMLYTENTANGWANIEKKIFLLCLPLVMASLPSFDKAELRRILQAFILTCFAATLICFGRALLHSLEYGTLLNFGLETMENFKSLNPHASDQWMYFSYIELSSGIGAHPTYFGLYLLFCLIAIFQLYSEGRFSSLQKRIALFLFFYFTLFIILLSSRIVTIGVMFLVLSAFYFNYQKARRRYVLTTLIVLCLTFSLIYVNPVSRYRNLQEVALTDITPHGGWAGNSLTIRTSLLQLSQRSLETINPWIGAGTGDVDDVMFSMSEQYQIKNILNTYDPHNQFVQTLIGLGLIGLLLLLVGFLAPLVIAYQRGFYLYVVFGIIFMAVCLTESALETQKGIVFYSVFSSLLFFHQSPLYISANRTAYA